MGLQKPDKKEGRFGKTEINGSFCSATIECRVYIREHATKHVSTPKKMIIVKALQHPARSTDVHLRYCWLAHQRAKCYRVHDVSNALFLLPQQYLTR